MLHPSQQAEKQATGQDSPAQRKTTPADAQRARQRERLLHIKVDPKPSRARPPVRGWRLMAVRWIGSCLLVLVAVLSLLQVAGLNPAQQLWLTIQTGPMGFYLRPTPTPTPRPTPTPLPPPPGSAAVISMIEATFGSTYSDGALAVARCESGYNANAVNPTPIGNSHASGVFQILYPSTWNTTSYKNKSPFDAQANISAAYEIFSRDGFSWREWQCKP